MRHSDAKLTWLTSLPASAGSGAHTNKIIDRVLEKCGDSVWRGTWQAGGPG